MIAAVGMLAQAGGEAVEAVGAPRESIRVVLREVPPTHWAAGDVTIAERHAARP